MADLKSTEQGPDLLAKYEELKIKESEATEALELEKTKSKEREAREIKKRQDLTHQLQAVQKENEDLRDERARLRDFEEWFKKAEHDLIELKKKRAVEQMKSDEDRKNSEDMLWERRRACEKLAQEVADLKCQISILEHKLENEKSKAGYQDQLQEEVLTYKNTVAVQEQQLEDVRCSAKTESMRFNRDRKLLEERISKLQNELLCERGGINKADLHEKYHRDVTQYQGFLSRALHVCSRMSMTMFAPSIEDVHAVETFLAKLEQRQIASPTDSEEILPLRSSNISNEFFLAIVEKLHMLPDEKQQRLLHRFESAIAANFSNSCQFGTTSGLPDRTEEPVVLLNHIANLTTQNELLLAKLQDVTIIDVDNVPELPTKSVRYLRCAATQEVYPLFVTEGSVFTIGRYSTLNLFINKDSISRVHAIIKCNPLPEEPVLVDVGSIHGTYVNGTKITGPVSLKRGDVVAFGDPANIFNYYDDVISPRNSGVLTNTVKGTGNLTFRKTVGASTRSKTTQPPPIISFTALPTTARRTPPPSPREDEASQKAKKDSMLKRTDNSSATRARRPNNSLSLR